ncbi:Cyclin-C, partial [Durusdinium trenchii]
MGCLCSRDGLSAEEELDRAVRRQEALPPEDVTVALLGAPGAGKNTLMRAVALCIEGQTTRLKLEKRFRGVAVAAMREQAAEGVADLVRAVPVDVQLASQEAEVAARTVREGDAASLRPDEVGVLWADPAVQAVVQRRGPGQMPRNLAKLCNEELLHKMRSDDFAPSLKEMLLASWARRPEDPAAYEQRAKHVQMVDASQDSPHDWTKLENHAWTLLLVDVSTFDQVFAGGEHPLLQTSVKLFEHACRANPGGAVLTVVFTKMDVFRDKLGTTPFRVDDGPHPRFTDYEGPNSVSEDGPGLGQDVVVASAVDHLKKLFPRNRFPQNSKGMPNEILTLNCLDTNSVQSLISFGTQSIPMGPRGANDLFAKLEANNNRPEERTSRAGPLCREGGMAANFWASSHCKRWLFEEDWLQAAAAKSRGNFVGELEASMLHDHMLSLIQGVGKDLVWRQPVIATAKLIYKRFYVKATLAKFDPRLVMVTSMYLAAKIEELGQYSLSKLLSSVGKQVQAEFDKTKFYFPSYSAQHVHDYEFHILEALSFDLVVFHPYQYLTGYAQDAQVGEACLQTAWDVVNDSYQTRVMLRFPPYLVALAALYIAAVHHSIAVRSWYNKLNVRLDDIREIAHSIMDMYRDRCDTASQRNETLLKVSTVVHQKFQKELR